ncbi:MAG: RagB/SusD family nutrient uptake outer membrane protein [Bacteroidales bacterium]|nr:RagB/SusD family nutrient uptake outer membrane protein [Bacteroidales bacterium]
MKRTAYITLLLLTLCTTSCEDYLGIKPRGYDVAEKIEHYEGLLYGTEMFLLNEVFPYMGFEFTIDQDGFTTAYSLMGAPETNAYLWKADIFREDENCGEWNHPASIMYPMNVVIAGVENASGGTPEKKAALKAEAVFIRAYVTFIMAQFFGKPYDVSTAGTDLCVPIITKATTMGQSFPRKTVEQVYEFVTSQMKQALPDLQSRAEHPYRVFATTGNAMLGKVLWMMGNYKEALPYLEQAMNMLEASGCGLLDYNTISSDGEITYPVDIKQNPELLYSYESMAHIWSAMYPSYYGSSLFAVKTDVVEKYFDKGDLRLCFFSGLKSGKTAYSKFDLKDVYSLNLSRFTTNVGVTVPDLYLIYAECLARNARYADAKAVLEELRRHRVDGASDAAVTAADGDDMVRFAVDERMREYIGYGNTWFDMRRLWDDPLFQDLKGMYVHTVGDQTYSLTKERLVMRIPPSILQWHPEYKDNE